MSIPTTEEELNRKALETVQNLMRRWQEGEISNGQLMVGAQVLFGAISGLANKEIIEIISTVGVFSEEVSIERLVLEKGDSLITMRREGVDVIMSSYKVHDCQRKTSGLENIDKAKQYFAGLTAGIKEHGYAEA